MVAKKTNKKQRKKSNKGLKTTPELQAGLLLLFAIISLASLVFTEQTGVLGNIIKVVFEYLAGERAWTIPIFIAILGGNLLYLKSIQLTNRFWGISLVLFLIVVGHHIELILQENIISRGEIVAQAFSLPAEGAGGGLMGAIFSTAFLLVLGEIGTFIVLIFTGIIAFMLLTDTTFKEGLSLGTGAAKKAWELVLLANEKLIEIYNRISNTKQMKEYQKGQVKNEDDTNILDFNDYKQGRQEEEDQGSLQATGGTYQDEPDYPIVSFEENEAGLQAKITESKEEANNSEPGPEDKREGQKSSQKSGSIQSNTNTGSETLAQESFSDGHGSDNQEKDKVVSYTFYPNESLGNYKLPPLNLLKKSTGEQGDKTDKRELSDRARLLEETLASFGVKARVIKVQKGPTITRFELQPEKGVKVSKIVNLSDDLALSLAASEIRIEAPIPGKAAIGIEIPNKVISPVYLREVLESPNFQKSESPLSIAIGKDIAGEPVVADLAKMPHLLIAGATGSGKSVSINTLIASILYKAKPDEVKLLLIDPKVVELKSFDGLPHLLAPVVTNPKNAASTLKNIVSEMEYRYQLFADTGVRDIAKYNAINKEEDYPEKLPYIVVIIDELADLMMVAPTEVEDGIFRLAQMSRAAGIHLILATQRPSVDVITGVIKSNITSRIAFAVTSQADSRTILDMGGAEKLLGQGDMLFTPMGSNKPIRLQGAFISDKEIDELAEKVKEQAEPQYQEELVTTTPETDKKQEYDELLPKAVELVMETQQASISLIQRRLRVGYTRAARLIDELEEFGVIGGHEGSKPRRILMTEEDIKNILEQL
ncbi:FtsK/SpoIIIE family DNA translocase [Natranaerobius thermophilus]|uniref:Cell divisionFtsK/SpoIIIE n=1 Tax=Natranaerobius thermophilus (strain ATCC BAA-1301 / DSM 18059 / JW/NM-WN-LF) TaxID=457570 RepID=B2A3B8_NATTJ|nr:cell divisionFtsK/SpoIIIE [Natranaerobius thermophilus JW/NM-WN-LF]